MSTLPRMTDCQTALFIEHVHSLPCLWDTTCADFRNRHLVQKTYEDTASKFQMTGK
jgi:hypothetical protein